MTMLCKICAGQGVRRTTLVLTVQTVFLALIFNALTLNALWADMPLTGPQTVVVDLQTCAGAGATATVELDAEYTGEFPGCGVTARMSASGWELTVTVEEACVPTESMTIGTIVVRAQDGTLNSVWIVKVDGGLVGVDDIDL